LAEFLIAKGANTEVKDKDGRTLGNMAVTQQLFEACKNGHQKDVEKLLTEGADIHGQTSCGYTPLHLAAEAGHTNVVKYLIEKGAAVNSKEGTDSPLLLASMKGFKDVVELLIAAGVHVNARNSFGITPMKYATDRGHTAVVELLMAKGAGSKPAQPIIVCSQCKTTYRIGVDTVAVSLDDVLSSGQTLVFGSVPSSMPILVDHSDPATPKEIIQESKAKILKYGPTSGWCCKKCGMGHVNRM
jgi:hypothetical protein